MKNQNMLSVAIGKFDGLHLGHAEVIKSAVEKKAENVSVAVIIIDNDSTDNLLTNSERAEKIYELGVDEIIRLQFDEIKNFSPEQFVRDILRDRLDVKYISVGFNFKFGKGALADCNMLKKIGGKTGMEVTVTEPVKVQGTVVSGTKIKELIKSGKISFANQMLGYNHFLQSNVIKGAGRGKKLGYPTVNQIPDDGRLVPKYGVYSSRILVDDEWQHSITNVGIHPTIEGGKMQYETHMLDCDRELYGENLRVELLEFTRSEKKFETLKELGKQLELDVAKQRQKNSLHFS